MTVQSHAAAFANVFSPARPVAAPAGRPAALVGMRVMEFLAACEAAVGTDRLASDDLLPGVDVEQPGAVLLAYLLFLATEALTPNAEQLTGDRVADWHRRLPPTAWKAMGFTRPPGLLALQLAFSLLADIQHLAAEVRALVWAVGDFAAIGLLDLRP